MKFRSCMYTPWLRMRMVVIYNRPTRKQWRKRNNMPKAENDMNWWNDKTIKFWPFGTTRNAFLAFFGMIFGAIGLIAFTHIAFGAQAPQACETQFYNKQMPDYDSAMWHGNDPSQPPEQVYTLCYTQIGLQNSAR